MASSNRPDIVLPEADKHPKSVHRSDTLEETNRISSAQRELLQETFNKMDEDGRLNGISIMVRLFAEFPRYKEIWPQLKAIPDSAIISSTELQRHAITYMGGLREIIAAMEDDCRLSDTIRKIALSHVKHGISKHHLQNMLPQVLAVLQGMRCLTPEVHEAWTTLFDVIGNLVDKFKKSENSHVSMGGRRLLG